VRTIVVLNPLVLLPDGRQFLPFNTNAPVRFGNETLTPSVVTYTNNNTRCTLTLDFVDTHTNNESVSSGTLGLQESLNDAAAFGGLVTVDGQWTNLGGTDAMISDATVPSGVSIEDVRNGASGAPISGSGTAGFIPQFASATEIEDSPIDNGLTNIGYLTFNCSGVDGAPGGAHFICANGDGSNPGFTVHASGGEDIPGSVDGVVSIVSGKGLQLFNGPEANSGSQLVIQQYDTGGIQIDDIGGGGISIQGIVSPSTLYSAAGTPLPAANSVPQGAEATVSDALLPTYMGAYTSGGTITCKVISDGVSNWFTH
jgi:hypothetical protein